MSIDTKAENRLPDFNPIRVAQFGGCLVKDITRYVPGAQVSAKVRRSSMTSLVSWSQDRSAHKSPAYPLTAKRIEPDFRKESLDVFGADDWDVLLLDLLNDNANPSVCVGGAYVTEVNYGDLGTTQASDISFPAPHQLIKWHDQGFFDLWSRSVETFYELLLKPALDIGRRVAVVELQPSLGELGGASDDEPFDADPSQRVFWICLGRMYAFAAALDNRIIRLKPEPEFSVGLFDMSSGSYSLHFEADFNARAGELLGEAIGICPKTIARHISFERLRDTRNARYARQVHETDLKREVGITRGELERAAIWAKSAAKQIEYLQSDLRAARSNMEAVRMNSEAQAEAIVALTARLASEISNSEAQRLAFLASEAELKGQVVAHECAFSALQHERDQLMESFRDHIGHYDALREELERMRTVDDETFAQVLALAKAVRDFATRHAITLASDPIEASTALTELAGQMADVRKSLDRLQSAVISAEVIGARPVLADALAYISSP